jgi:hypothetical protein
LDSIVNCLYIPTFAGVYILTNMPPGGILADVTWGKKYEKGQRDEGEHVKEKGRKRKDEGEKFTWKSKTNVKGAKIKAKRVHEE